MSVRTSPTARRSPGLAAWSSSTASERSSDMPELLSVANWREKTDRSLSVVRPVRPGMDSSLRSPIALCSVIASGTAPCCRSACAAAVSLSASIVPLPRLPAASTIS